ncbi:MAG: ATPase [Gammaproteobacteria bacterium]|nr:ATPase [Gammaproteobacteria bacterium]
MIGGAHAFTPTPEQIEQFQQLPREEQERLARQYGVDLNQLMPAGAAQAPAMPADTPNQRKMLGQPDVVTFPTENVQPPEPATADTDTQLKPYGYDLFSNNATAFQPNVDIPVPADYVVGPGDTFVVQLYGKENASYSLSVSREGVIQLPEIGPIALAGLKFSEAQGVIERTISEQMIGVKCSVTMGTLRTIRVFVLGEAVQPGSYIVGSLSTMTNALFASGGITPIGSLRSIQLKRQGEIVTTLDLYDLLLNGDTRDDARLLPGDVIFIPPVGTTVGVSGEVRRPALYEVRGEKSAADLIRLAGGFLPTAYPSASRIERISTQGERTVVNIDLARAEGKNLAVKTGDVIRIFSVLDTMENIVTVAGHVKRPGINAWKPGARVSTVLGSIRELLPNPDLNAAIIERELPPTGRLKIISFNLGEALTKPGSAADISLQPRDKITVFDLEKDRSKLLEPVIANLRVQASRENRQKVVSISGNVRFPGSYPLTDNMSAQQLIALAGGLSENAYNLEGEITRYSLDAEQRQQIEYVDLKLASAAQYPLREEDRLSIRRLPDWSPEETIELSGEIRFPGKYTIRRGETLSQILQRAGGLTNEAYPEGAVFTRKDLQVLESQRLQELKRQLESDIAAANIEQQDDKEKVNVQDAQQLLKNIEDVRPLGRMVIDLPLLVSKPEQQDVRILSGDTLHVPRHKQSVTVVGEVQFPTSHLFEAKLDVQDYIERSGGTNLKADKSRVYVVKANGRVFLPQKSGWFSRDMVSVEPGDTVVVPLDADRIKSLTLWTSVSQIVYQVALGAAAVASF